MMKDIKSFLLLRLKNDAAAPILFSSLREKKNYLKVEPSHKTNVSPRGYIFEGHATAASENNNGKKKD